MSSNTNAFPTVIQFVTNLNYADAISDEALVIKHALREWGYPTSVYSQHVAPRMRGKARQFHVFKPPNDHWLAIYHHSIASDLGSFVQGLDCPKIMIYHNVTPPEYFYGTNYFMGELARKGRADLADQAVHYDLGLGDSDFNRRDLEHAGFKRTGVLPLILDFHKFDTPPNQAILRRYQDGCTNLLFVGRVAPNKRQEDVIKAFHFYKQLDPTARLILVGSDDTTEPYRRWLEELVDSLGVSDVTFTGRVELRDLNAYYDVAHVYFSMSEHEGFGVPLVESMHFGVPIVAYASTAVPETLGGSGLLIKRKDYAAIAAAIFQVRHDVSLHEQMVARGRERLREFEPQRILQKLRSYIQELVE